MTHGIFRRVLNLHAGADEGYGRSTRWLYHMLSGASGCALTHPSPPWACLTAASTRLLMGLTKTEHNNSTALTAKSPPTNRMDGRQIVRNSSARRSILFKCLAGNGRGVAKQQDNVPQLAFVQWYVSNVNNKSRATAVHVLLDMLTYQYSYKTTHINKTIYR